jgi:hypothetical protein
VLHDLGCSLTPRPTIPTSANRTNDPALLDHYISREVAEALLISRMPLGHYERRGEPTDFYVGLCHRLGSDVPALIPRGRRRKILQYAIRNSIEVVVKALAAKSEIEQDWTKYENSESFEEGQKLATAATTLSKAKESKEFPTKTASGGVLHFADRLLMKGLETLPLSPTDVEDLDMMLTGKARDTVMTTIPFVERSSPTGPLVLAMRANMFGELRVGPLTHVSRTRSPASSP